MKNDLAEQLRLLNTFEWMARPATTKQICFDAADCIEKLEVELHSCFHRIEELQTALRAVVVHCEVPAPPNAEALKMFARKALEGDDD